MAASFLASRVSAIPAVDLLATAGDKVTDAMAETCEPSEQMRGSLETGPKIA